jgi:tRNA nucleotidyltransferase/poly(A) polymerase
MSREVATIEKELAFQKYWEKVSKLDDEMRTRIKEYDNSHLQDEQAMASKRIGQLRKKRNGLELSLQQQEQAIDIKYGLQHGNG